MCDYTQMFMTIGSIYDTGIDRPLHLFSCENTNFVVLAQSEQTQNSPQRSQPTQPSPTRFSEAQVLNAISEIRAPALVILAEPRASFFEAATVDGRLAAFKNAEVLNVQGNHHLHVCPDAALVAKVAGFFSAS